MERRKSGAIIIGRVEVVCNDRCSVASLKCCSMEIYIIDKIEKKNIALNHKCQTLHWLWNVSLWGYQFKALSQICCETLSQGSTGDIPRPEEKSSALKEHCASSCQKAWDSHHSQIYFFFFLKEHVSCFTFRAYSLCIWTQFFHSAIHQLILCLFMLFYHTLRHGSMQWYFRHNYNVKPLLRCLTVQLFFKLRGLAGVLPTQFYKCKEDNKFMQQLCICAHTLQDTLSNLHTACLLYALARVPVCVWRSTGWRVDELE